jgi:hypothetical protein
MSIKRVKKSSDELEENKKPAKINTGRFVKGAPPPAGAGAPALPPELKIARKLNKVIVLGILNDMVEDDVKHVAEIAKDKGSKVIDAMIAAVVSRGVKDGNEKILDFVLERLIGKVTEEHKHTIIGNVNAALVNKIAQLQNSPIDDSDSDPN